MGYFDCFFGLYFSTWNCLLFKEKKMEDHFERMFSTLTKEENKDLKKKNKNKEEFINSERFLGGKEGYIFQRGPSGVGYYLDKYPSSSSSSLTYSTTNQNKNVTPILPFFLSFFLPPSIY